MARPVRFRKPWLKSGKSRSAGEWIDRLRRKAGDTGGPRKPPKNPLPPGSGMPADPPDRPSNPPLAGGAAVPLDQGGTSAP